MEVLIDLAIISIVATAVAAAYSAAFRSIDLAKAKISAVALANEKMEQIRNMPYDNLATEHGTIYPAGNILDDEEVVRKGIRFNVYTVISYVDDPFDGLASSCPVEQELTCQSPCDCYSYDYKKVEITVSKIGRQGYLARLSSSVAAKAAETPSNTGLLQVCVIDSVGNPLAESSVTIVNNSLDPRVEMNAETGLNGCILIPGLPEDRQNHYHLEVTRAGYSTDMTYERTAQNQNATQPDVDVLIQQITSQTLIIDHLSTMNISVVDTDGNSVPNVGLHVWGTKTKWFNPETYKYDKGPPDLVTDANGQLILNEMEFDDYHITVDGWNIVATSPYQPVGLKAGQTLPVKVIVSQSPTFPTISTAAPLTSVAGSVAAVTIHGLHLSGPASVKLINAGGVEIVGESVIYTQHGQDEWIDVDFNLSGAETGFWDIIITNTDGESVRQERGFEVVE